MQWASRVWLEAIWVIKLYLLVTAANYVHFDVLGPRGTLKMLVDGAGQIKMTKVLVTSQNI